VDPGRVKHPKDLYLLSGVIDGIQDNVRLAHDGQLADARNLSDRCAVWKVGQPLDRKLDRRNDLGRRRWVVRCDVGEYLIELRDGAWAVPNPHRPYLAYIAATSSSVANSPRRAAASSASSSARSCGVNSVGGRVSAERTPTSQLLRGLADPATSRGPRRSPAPGASKYDSWLTSSGKHITDRRLEHSAERLNRGIPRRRGL
jgi:hypothetical protein